MLTLIPISVNPSSQTSETPLELVKLIMLNNITQTLNQIPGNRIYLFLIMNFFSVFDRLQFYYYHRQQQTASAEVFLSGINTMALERGSLLQNILNNCENSSSICSSINEVYSGLVEAFDHQLNYTHPDFLEKNPNGIGFFANNLEFFFYELPGCIIIFIILSLIFKALFNHRISKHLRKYSLYGTILFVIYEGNAEQFAFYFFMECQNLFSRTFSHKLAHIFMINFFFLLIVFAVGGLIFLRFHYKKLVKYMAEDSKAITLDALLLEALERSLFPIIFGSIHSLFLENLGLQSIILGAVEVAYFGSKLYSLRQNVSKYRFKILMLALTSILRMGFITTFY